MPRLSIDNQMVEVPPGATVLDAARKLGIDIPTMCHLDDCNANGSCMVCLVRLGPSGRFAPSCATRAEEGMVAQSETPEVHAARKAALELLLSDHVGDCLAPCERTCPAHMDIPRMLRDIAAGDFRAALETVKDDIALPAVLGRICPAPCEKNCRRAPHGGAVSICLLKRVAADEDLALQPAQQFLPACAPDSGKKVAVVGAGPAGLAAAYYLRRFGHAVTVLDDREDPGGMLRYGTPEADLPRSVLEGEIDAIRQIGAEFRMRTRVGPDIPLDQLRRDFDAVLLTVGDLKNGAHAILGSPPPAKGVAVDPHTFATPTPGLFAAGGAVRPSKMAVRSVGEGHVAAASIDQYLRGRPVTGLDRASISTIGRLETEESSQMLFDASANQRADPHAGVAAGLTVAEAIAQAARCLHCDCRKADDCKLRVHAHRYGADGRRYDGARRPVQIRVQRDRVVYEPGKCIACGLCVQIASRMCEPLGLAMIGRGFDVRPGVPFDASWDKALTSAAEACVRACPTGALANRR